MRKKALVHFPMIHDIQKEYLNYRRNGISREDAIHELIEAYAAELKDEDDAPQVWIGLAYVTSVGNELTTKLMMQAEKGLDRLMNQHPEMAADLLAFRDSVCDASRLGPEAKYPLPHKRSYRPDWEEGDTFAYELQGEYSRSFGLEGWFIILRKKGEATGHTGNSNPLVYMTLCPPGQLPDTEVQLASLGYLPFGYCSDGYVFKGQMELNARNIKRLKLMKIGCYPLLSSPQNEGQSFPLPGWPLFFIQGDEPNDLEIKACLNYHNIGIIKNRE